MESKRSYSTRKPIKRRSHKRRGTKDCSINMAEANLRKKNMAEARREVINALQLHRSSSASASSCDQKWGSTIIGNGCNHGIISYSSCSSLLDTLPLPEPTWSTTAPSVLATPSPPMEALEFEWSENLASSHTWWLGFLKALDGKHAEVPPPRACPDGSKLGESLSLDEISDESSYLDEWLTVPTIEDEGEIYDANPKENGRI